MTYCHVHSTSSSKKIMPLIIAAVKLVHFNLNYLMITLYWNIIIICISFRDTACVMELNTASLPGPLPPQSHMRQILLQEKVNFNAVSAGILSLLLWHCFNLTSSLNQWRAGVYEGNLVAQIVFILFKRSGLSSELTRLNSTHHW